MGFGDPYHKHPLIESRYPPRGVCFHCELPFHDDSSYGCDDCEFYIHKWCHDLPIALTLPLHDQHLLTRTERPPSSFSDSPNLLCNECQNPCVGRFAYHCTTCQFHFHLNCLFTLNHQKHDHPLIFCKQGVQICKICGSYIFGFSFGCDSCKFYIHHECSLIPLEVKHHHVHMLTLRHNFPEECDQVYCDLCEDKDGELDRSLSYYYCKRCDYIAHKHCCITQPREDVLLCESFIHEHPLRPIQTASILSCSQCSYLISDDAREYPSCVKHPCHPHDTLVVDGERYAGSVEFTHPLWRYELRFNCKNNMFRCDACGELGKGSRMGYYDGSFDFHLECFALPGTLEHESHPNHPLYLRWLDESTSRYCSVCTKEIDPQLWLYFCQECDYAAHMDCVARDLLSSLRSSIKNQRDFCAIIEPNHSLFKYSSVDMRPRLNFSRPSCSIFLPVLEVLDDDDNEGNSDRGIEAVDNVLACPNCSSIIPTQAGYSSIEGWKSGFLKDSITANDQIPSASEPLSFLEEQIIDENCCAICNMLIFPPTYSCASCQIYFHKSCAELPRKILYNDTTYVLMAPPFPEGLSNCSYCRDPISGFAYLSPGSRTIFDVRCALGAPLVKPTYHKHMFYFTSEKLLQRCEACKNYIVNFTFLMKCKDCDIYLHPECGSLPPVIKHRIHWHPLELATDLAELYDEYICDVCEKDLNPNIWEYICDVCEKDLNPNIWAYRCVDECGIRATSHVSCVLTSKNKCHFDYIKECRNMTEEEKLEFKRKVMEQNFRK